MPITFENDNDPIIYALECVIAYARRTQQIFMAQCVWWLSSIIGLEQALVSHINKLHNERDTTKLQGERDTVKLWGGIDSIPQEQLPREVSSTP